MKKVLEKIIKKLLYSCEKATYLIEKKASAQPISVLEDIRLKGHLAMCKFCRAYNKKVSIIDKAMIMILNKSSEKISETELKDFINHLKGKNLQ